MTTILRFALAATLLGVILAACTPASPQSGAGLLPATVHEVHRLDTGGGLPPH